MDKLAQKIKYGFEKRNPDHRGADRGS